MSRTDLRRRVDLVLLGAGALTFLAGLVLLFAFHADDGEWATSALGVPRLVWLDLHRLAAAALVAGVAVHLGLDARAFLGQLRRAFSRRRSGARIELVLYAAFFLAAGTGLAAWLLVDGSSPLLGPVPLGPLPHGRHSLVEVHNLAGLIALALAVHHVWLRWRFLVRRPAGEEA
jgi:hypothetical protein